MMPPDAGDARRAACGACAIRESRRDFLRETALAVSALVGLAVLPRDAFALPLSFVSARMRAGALIKYPVPAADGAQIDRPNEVILVRWENVAYAFNLSCPHQNTALRWDEDDHRFQCPKHHSQYQPDGIFITGRATRGMDRLGIRLEADTLIVDLDQFYQQDKDVEAWKAAFVKLSA
jgi:nitrite reductase/ring-hydroxylating ferredoxin subunit